MQDFITYLFWPNNGPVSYDNPKMLTLLGVALALMIGSFVIRYWLRTVQNPVTKKLARSWPSALFWFGIVAIILVVSRAENILFLQMRFLWGVWALAFLLYIVVQVLQFRNRHYVLVKQEKSIDPRAKYLPKKKK